MAFIFTDSNNFKNAFLFLYFNFIFLLIHVFVRLLGCGKFVMKWKLYFLQQEITEALRKE